MDVAARRRWVDRLQVGSPWARSRPGHRRDTVAAARGARRRANDVTWIRKRVLYLDADVFAESMIGSAVDAPLITDDRLRQEASWLDRALVLGDDFEAESRLALVVERLAWHLTGRPSPAAVAVVPAVVARRAREVMDEDPVAIGGLAGLAQSVGVSPAHLVRSFTRSYGIPPNRYLLGRRLDLARRRLLAGEAPGDVATATGFYDQAHFNRHFKQLLAITPGRYQRSAI